MKNSFKLSNTDFYTVRFRLIKSTNSEYLLDSMRVDFSVLFVTFFLN